MFSLSEMLVIAALALIFIGPKQLPEVARALGKLFNELKRAGDEAMQALHDTPEKFLSEKKEEEKKDENGTKS